MSSQTAMSLMVVVEFALWAVLGILFWIRKLHRRFPAMSAYLALHVASMPVLLVLFYGQARHWFNGYSFNLGFYIYWAVYIASAVLLYFVCIEIFHSAFSVFSGLQRLGVVVFRWTALASIILSLSTLSFGSSRILLLPAIAFKLMRSVSILELCLLGFLCLSMNALCISVRDKAFGIALGLGLMSTNDFVESFVVSIYTSLTAPWQFVYQSVILLALGMWVAYVALPEPARQALMVPANSLIFRWNDIATALGHTGTKVAVQPAGGFSLTEAENAVEEALTKDLISRASAT
jgi:hypothetical protein